MDVWEQASYKSSAEGSTIVISDSIDYDFINMEITAIKPSVLNSIELIRNIDNMKETITIEGISLAENDKILKIDDMWSVHKSLEGTNIVLSEDVQKKFNSLHTFYKGTTINFKGSGELNGIITYIAEPNTKTHMDEIFASAVKNSATGSVIALNDVSPVPHVLSTEVESTNLFKVDANNLVDGFYNDFIGCTPMDTSIITDNGMATASLYKYPFLSEIKKGDKITLSFKGEMPEGSYCKIYVFGTYSDGYTYSNNSGTVNDNKVTWTAPDTLVSITQLQLRIGSNVGTSVTYSDIILNKGSEALPYTPYVEDLTQSEVSVMGGNIYPFEPNMTVTGDGTQKIIKIIPVNKNLKNYEMTIDSFVNDNIVADDNENIIFVRVKYSDGSEEYRTLVIKKNGVIFKQAVPFKNVNVNEIWLYKRASFRSGTITLNGIMIGIKGIPYEPYKEPVPYKPLADGTVENVQSISPNMTLVGSEGITIDTEYNADTKLYIDNQIEEIKKAIVSMGAI